MQNALDNVSESRNAFILASDARPELMAFVPLENERAQGRPGASSHPRPVCIGRKHTVVTTGGAGSGLPCAMVLTVTSCSPRGPGSLAPVIPEKLASQELSASVGAPGPHDFAVRARRRSSSDTTCVHRIPPHVRDDANAPLVEAGRRGEYTISDFRKAKYLCAENRQPKSA
jgi:hypothetical protein